MAEERRARHEVEARLYDDKDAHTLSDQHEQRFLTGRLAEITALNELVFFLPMLSKTRIFDFC
jgi:hypothetical protein